MILRTILIILCCLVDVAFANSQTVQGLHGWLINTTSSSNDLSLLYLDQIFGGVLGIDPTADGTLISDLMRVFNYGVIAFVGGGVATTVAMSVVNTSREGTFMGRALPTAWYPFRVIVGVGFLAPTASGYSGIQIIILSVAMYGVTLANMAWDMTTKYVTTHEGGFQKTQQYIAEDSNSAAQSSDSTQVSDKTQNREAVEFGQHILTMQTCLAYNKKRYDAIQSTQQNQGALTKAPYLAFTWCPNPSSCSPDTMQSSSGLSASPQSLYKRIEIKNPEHVHGNGQQGEFIQNCRLSIPMSPPKSCPTGSMTESQCNEHKIEYNHMVARAIDVYYQQLRPLVTDLFRHCDLVKGACSSSTQPGVTQLSCLSDSKSNCRGADILSASAQTFSRAMQAAQQQYLFQIKPTQDPTSENSIAFGSGGWATAGQFYHYLSKQQAILDAADQQRSPITDLNNSILDPVFSPQSQPNVDSSISSAGTSSSALRTYYEYAQYLKNYFTQDSPEQNQKEALTSAALTGYQPFHEKVMTVDHLDRASRDAKILKEVNEIHKDNEAANPLGRSSDYMPGVSGRMGFDKEHYKDKRYSAAAMKAVGFSDEDLASIGYTQSELKVIEDKSIEDKYIRAQSTFYGTTSQLTVRDRLYTALVRMMPRGCTGDPDQDTAGLGVCSPYGLSKQFIEQLNAGDTSLNAMKQRAIARAAYEDLNTRAMQKQASGNAFSVSDAWDCIWGGWYSPMVPWTTAFDSKSDQNCIESDGVTQSTVIDYGGLFLGRFPPGLDLNKNPNILAAKAIGIDMQIYIYKLGKAWLDAFIPQRDNASPGTAPKDLKAQFPNINVIHSIAKFGQDLLSSNVNFLQQVTQDIFKAQVYAETYYTMERKKYDIASEMSGKVAGMFKMAGLALVHAGLVFPPFTLPLIPIGSVVTLTSVAPSVIGQYYKLKERVLAYRYMLFKARTFIYVPITVAVTVPLIILGLLTWVFLPLLPFIVFFLTVVGWFISVIEAVVAAPLVAAGITSPVGHEFLGRAEQSMMLVVSVVVRPILILMSFIVAVIATYASVWLSSQLMMIVLAEFMSKIVAHSGQFSVFSGYVSMLLMCYVYVYVLFQIINQTFGLVYEVPAYVMRWIGAPREDTPKEAISSIRGEALQMFGKVAESGAATQKQSMGTGM
jgi:conjugal transfer/type IV secretion protein DotA/TraY